MNPQHITRQGDDTSSDVLVTDENATGATGALMSSNSGANIDRKNDLRNKFKSALFGSISDDEDELKDLGASPPDSPENDIEEEDCLDTSVDLPETLVVSSSRYRLLTDDDLLKLPPVQWRIKDVLPSHGTAVIFGPSGSGKSFLVLDMLQSLALGRDWFGRRVKPCSVTYIALEGEAGLSKRLDAYRIQNGATAKNIRYIVQPFRLLNTDDINELVQAIQTARTGDVVVLDTLSRAIPGTDENDGKAMGQIIAAAKILQDLIGGLVILIHHTGKDTSRGMRGHSSLHAALDCAIEVKRSGEHREWVVAKSKEGEDGESHSFKLTVVSLGVDGEGDEITSCVIVASQSSHVIRPKMPTLGSNQTIALKALDEALSKSVDIDKDGVPPNKPCLNFEHALEIVAPLIPVGDKHKKQRAKDALAGLVNKDVVAVKGDWLWRN
jgi:hypothetical protein